VHEPCVQCHTTCNTPKRVVSHTYRSDGMHSSKMGITLSHSSATQRKCRCVLICMCNMTHCDVCVCVTGLICMCDLAHRDVSHS